MGSAAVGALDQALQNDIGFRSDLAAASSKEHPVNVSGYGDLAGWLMTQASCAGPSRHTYSAVVGARGESHPSKRIGDRNLGELVSFHYVSGCMVDVTTYREAVQKFGEEADVQEKQWRTLHEHMLAALPDFIRLCSRVLGTTQRVGMKRNKGWLAKAVFASVSHRWALKTILEVKDSDISQVNVFALYSLGIAKKGMLDSIVSHWKLPGVTLVFPRNSKEFEAKEHC